MNEKFFNLPPEKQLLIINAGFEVFGTNDYQKASTELIALKAGISKGLLFYYFKNKKEFFFYLFEYTSKVFNETLNDEELFKITDFFNFCLYSAGKKFELLQRFPFINRFTLKAFYSKQAEISSELNDRIHKIKSTVFEDYLKNIDFSKFKDNISFKDVFEMLSYMLMGYMFDRQRCGIDVTMDDVMKKYTIWAELIKNIAYKEEYQ